MRLNQCLLEQSTKLPSFAFQGLDLPEPEDEDDEEEVDEEVDV